MPEGPERDAVGFRRWPDLPGELRAPAYAQTGSASTVPSGNARRKTQRESGPATSRFHGSAATKFHGMLAIHVAGSWRDRPRA